jgi:2-amino-4-hydroxy-6-hydroxymethyldihydropteridine diphosphokinase
VETAYVSIGSNIGEREAHVLRAIRALERSEGISVTAESSLYETPPFECPAQRYFINMVAEVKTLLSPLDLLKRLKEIEARMGRTGAWNEPRHIDLDIVSLGDTVMKSDALIIPHPRFHRRAFVLVPLLEIAPGYVCPAPARSGAQLLRDIEGDQGVELVSSRKCVFR